MRFVLAVETITMTEVSSAIHRQLLIALSERQTNLSSVALSAILMLSGLNTPAAFAFVFNVS